MEIEKHTYHPITGGLVVPQKPIFQMVEALNTLGIKELQHIDASHQGFFQKNYLRNKRQDQQNQVAAFLRRPSSMLSHFLKECLVTQRNRSHSFHGDGRSEIFKIRTYFINLF